MQAQSQVDDTMIIPNAPDVPGMRFRRYRGEADLPGMVEVFNASAEADGTERYATLEDLAKVYSNLKNSEPDRDMIITEVTGANGSEIVGYSRVTWQVELDGTRIYEHFGFLKPEWRGKGVGTALVPWAEARLREIAADHPDTGPRFLNSSAVERQTNLTDLLERRGYRPVRHGYDMLRPDLENIPDTPLPEGLDVRPVTPEHLRAIWEAEVEAFRDHWGSSEPDEGDFQRWLNESPFQPELWQVAWDGGQVAGMVRTFIDHNQNARLGRQRGYTENISTRRPWRRRGLARALMVLSMRLQKELGMTETALSADASNPSGAVQLYQSMGFQVIRTETVYRKPL
jgi:ribosomal protein S18 acetylase RimI-like enzyme